MAKKEKFTVDRPKKSELRRMAQVVTDALVMPSDLRSHMLQPFKQLGLANLRVIRAGSEIVGGLGILPMGHYFGGKRVGCAGITLVGVSPEWRRRGAASTLMTQMLLELHAKKFPLSSLFASTNALYRKCGYEPALVKNAYVIKARDIRMSDRECEMIPAKRGATKQFRDAYRIRALNSSGNLDRHEILWQWRHNPKKRVAHRYLVKCAGKVEGYLVYTQERKGEEVSIDIRDVCIVSAPAGRRVLTFFADHATVAGKIRWAGGPNDALLELLPENVAKTLHSEPLLLRIVSVPLALRARGYPANLEARVDFRISDDLLAQNNGDFTVKVSGGKATVRRGGTGRVRLDIRALAQLYTGKYSPRELALLGRIEAGEKELDALAPVFAGPAPWLPDDF